MHEKLLAGISRDLGELKARNPKKYKELEDQLGVISERADLEVHRSLHRNKMRKVS